MLTTTNRYVALRTKHHYAATATAPKGGRRSGSAVAVEAGYHYEGSPPQEILALETLARRLAVEQATYGPLDLVYDRRGLGGERAAELADALVYTAKAGLRRGLRRRPVRRALAASWPKPSSGIAIRGRTVKNSRDRARSAPDCPIHAPNRARGGT